jgi:hypothetical protein
MYEEWYMGSAGRIGHKPKHRAILLIQRISGEVAQM